MVVEDLAATVAAEIVPPDLKGPNVCTVCRSWTAAEQESCHNCTAIEGTLGQVLPVDVTSLYCKPSPMRDWLTLYKPNEEALRPEFGTRLAEMLDQRLATASSDWQRLDLALVVPSTSRPPPHPLEAVVRPVIVKRLGITLTRRLARGSGELGHNRPSRTAFTVSGTVRGLRILLVDDVYTTGARAQSAAFALMQAGAAAVHILVLGRRINPKFNAAAAALWERQRAAARSSAPAT